MHRLKRHLTFANVCSALALFLVLTGGTAIAVVKLGRNVVKSRNIAPGQVKTSDLGDGAVIASKLAAGVGAGGAAQLGANSVSGSNIQPNAISGSHIQPNSVDASKIPDDSQGNDNVNASRLGGLSPSFFQLGDGADQVLQGAGLSFGEQTTATGLGSGQFSLKCAATPTVEFTDYPGDPFSTDAWEPIHSTIADGGSRSFNLPTNGQKVIEIYGAGGDLLVVSSFVTGTTCIMIAHSSSNFVSIFTVTSASATPERQSQRARAASEFRGTD
jgi:hypothetical protein